MALTVNNTDYLVRTAGLPSSGFTLTWWQMITTDRNAYSACWMLWESGATNPRYIQGATIDDGTSQTIEVHESTNNGSGWRDTGTLINMSTSVWYFFAATLSAFSGAYTVNGYGRAATSTALSSGTNSGTWTGTFAPTNFNIGNETVYNTYIQGRVANFKMWNAVLTSAEILAESWQVMPVRMTSLRNVWPLYHNNRLYDYGPSKQNWAPNFFNPVEIAGPPIPLTTRRARNATGAGGAPPAGPTATIFLLRA